MGAYDGYKYAKKKGYKGWKKYAAIAGGAALGVVNPFKVFKVARTGYKTYKAVKYSKKARAAYKATKVTKKAKAKPKHTVVMKKNTKAKLQSKPAVRNSKGIKKLQKSAGGTIGCFTAGTKIHTKDGFKAIETIKAGDYVWSENPETHEKALKKVKKIFVREKDSVVRLSINGEAIETTNEHPFYVEGHGWANASDLKVGDKVRLEDGTTGTVEKAKHVKLDTPVTVYNFEVEDFHTYYVSEQKVLVHNTCAEPAKSAQKKSTEVIMPSKPHRNKTPGHWETILETVDELKNSGNYSKIYVNKGIRNEVKGALVNRRPDIMAVRHDGTIDQFEIPSKTDKIEKLYERINKSRNAMGERAGNIAIRMIIEERNGLWD